jgi:hypothetical protein
MFGRMRGCLPVAGPLASLVAVMALAGCGGGDTESTAKDEPEFAAANESERVFIKRAANLLATTRTKNDCVEVKQVNSRSLTRFPCPSPAKLRRSMADFEIVGAEDYGTGAVIDYKSGKLQDGAAIVLFVAPDRQWGISRFGVITKPSTGTSDEDVRDDYEKTIDTYLTAIEERDCATFKKVSFNDDVDPKDVCKKAFPDTKVIARNLKANPDARPVYQGGNGTYGFFTLETAKPQPANSTISVVATGDKDQPYVVLNVVPSPTAAEQRRVQREFRRQQRENAKQSKGSKEPLPREDGTQEDGAN